MIQQPELPNITGEMDTASGAGFRNDTTFAGCFMRGTEKSYYATHSAGTGYTLKFNAANSNSIYKNNGIVRPYSLFLVGIIKY